MQKLDQNTLDSITGAKITLEQTAKLAMLLRGVIELGQMEQDDLRTLAGALASTMPSVIALGDAIAAAEGAITAALRPQPPRTDLN